MARAKTKPPRIEDIQGHTSSLRAQLASLGEQIRAAQSATEPLLPRAAEADAMTEGSRPPSIAWEVHRWLGETDTSVRDALETMDWASTASEDTRLAIWLRRLCDGPDQNAYKILSAELRKSPDGDVRVPLPANGEASDPKKVLRALVVQMAQELYRVRTGGHLEILPRLRQGHQWTPGVNVFHITAPGADKSLCGLGSGPNEGLGADLKVRKKCQSCWKKYPLRSA